jgi:hypothetical protein
MILAEPHPIVVTTMVGKVVNVVPKYAWGNMIPTAEEAFAGGVTVCFAMII